MDQAVINFVKKQKFKSLDKVFPKVKAQFPQVTKSQVRKIIKGEVVQDIASATIKRNEKYYNKTFDNHRKGWMHDILFSKPHLYHVFIGTNTRYARAYPIPNKSIGSVLGSLKQFLSDEKCVALTSDSEPAFLSKEVLKYLDGKNIDIRIVTESRKTGLSILNRFIRTLRDMRGNKPLTPEKLQKLISEYNSTNHSAINMTPAQMHSDKDAEVEYIYKMLGEQSKVEAQDDYELPVGTKVRLIVRKEKMNKKRYNVSPDYYTISGKDGMSYIVSAADGSTKTVSRFEIVPVGSGHKFKYAKTFDETSRGTVAEIIKYYPKTKKYKVRFDMPDGTDYFDTIPESYLRQRHPLRKTQLEIDYFKSLDRK